MAESIQQLREENERLRAQVEDADQRYRQRIEALEAGAMKLFRCPGTRSAKPLVGVDGEPYTNPDGTVQTEDVLVPCEIEFVSPTLAGVCPVHRIHVC